MARTQVDPAAHGIALGKEEFIGVMVKELEEYGRGDLTIDELLLRPRAAIHFCDSVRQKYGWFDLPDDIALRVILTRRKNPVA